LPPQGGGEEARLENGATDSQKENVRVVWGHPDGDRQTTLILEGGSKVGGFWRDQKSTDVKDGHKGPKNVQRTDERRSGGNKLFRVSGQGKLKDQDERSKKKGVGKKERSGRSEGSNRGKGKEGPEEAKKGRQSSFTRASLEKKTPGKKMQMGFHLLRCRWVRTSKSRADGSGRRKRKSRRSP